MVNELMLVLRQAMCSVHQFGDFTRRRRSELLTLRSHFTHLLVVWCGAVPTVAFTHRILYCTVLLVLTMTNSQSLLPLLAQLRGGRS